MADIFNMADTWNAGGTTFTAIKMDVTDTASASASLLLDLQVGSATKFNVSKAGAVQIAAGTFYEWAGRSKIYSDADGRVRLANQAGTDFSRLQFGGNTSAYPALKRNVQALETRLSDDSAYAQHNMSILAVVDGVTAPTATAGLAKLYVDTADGDLKIIFGDGTVKTVVVDT